LVYSEADVVRGVGIKADKAYIVVWQNIDWKLYWSSDIINVIKNAVTLYES
jgi:hypothetical protein